MNKYGEEFDEKEHVVETEWILVPLISGYTTVEFTGKPIGTPYYEQILIYENDYPFAVVHVDTFWKAVGDEYIYKSLLEGNQLTLKVTFDLIDEDYPRNPSSPTEG